MPLNQPKSTFSQDKPIKNSFSTNSRLAIFTFPRIAISLLTRRLRGLMNSADLRHILAPRNHCSRNKDYLFVICLFIGSIVWRVHSKGQRDLKTLLLHQWGVIEWSQRTKLCSSRILKAFLEIKSYLFRRIL